MSSIISTSIKLADRYNGPYALRRSVNEFSSSALGKINKFLLRSFIRQFAGSASVKFLFLLCAPISNFTREVFESYRRLILTYTKCFV